MLYGLISTVSHNFASLALLELLNSVASSSGLHISYTFKRLHLMQNCQCCLSPAPPRAVARPKLQEVSGALERRPHPAVNRPQEGMSHSCLHGVLLHT